MSPFLARQRDPRVVEFKTWVERYEWQTLQSTETLAKGLLVHAAWIRTQDTRHYRVAVPILDTRTHVYYVQMDVPLLLLEKNRYDVKAMLPDGECVWLQGPLSVRRAFDAW